MSGNYNANGVIRLESNISIIGDHGSKIIASSGWNFYINGTYCNIYNVEMDCPVKCLSGSSNIKISSCIFYKLLDMTSSNTISLYQNTFLNTDFVNIVACTNIDIYNNKFSIDNVYSGIKISTTSANLASKMIQIYNNNFIGKAGILIDDTSTTAQGISFNDINIYNNTYYSDILSTEDSYFLSVNSGNNLVSEINVYNNYIKYKDPPSPPNGMARKCINMEYALLSNSNISENTISNGMFGIYFNSMSTNLNINNNNISNCFGAGMYIESVSNSTVNNNVISNTLSGAPVQSIMLGNSSARIICLGNILQKTNVSNNGTNNVVVNNVVT